MNIYLLFEGANRKEWLTFLLHGAEAFLKS